MFCRHCGYKLPDDSSFCPKCGFPVQQSAGASAGDPARTADNTPQTGGTIYNQQKPVQQAPSQGTVYAGDQVIPDNAAPAAYEAPREMQQAPVEAAVSGGAAVKVKKKSPVKMIVLLLAAALIIAAIVYILITFVFRKPGTAFAKALQKTLASDSFAVDVTYEYDYDEYLAFVKEFNLDNSASDMLSYEELREKYGLEDSDLKFKGYAAVSGKGDDFVAYAQIAGIYQFRWDEDYIEYKVGNSYLEENGIETESHKDKNKGEIRDVYDIVSAEDVLSAVKDNKELNSDLKEYFAKNYDQAFDVLVELLNDTDAKYIKNYEKSGNTYTLKIDVIKFMNAVEKNKTLKCTDRFIDEVDDLERDLAEEGIEEVYLDLTFTVGWTGKFESIILKPEVEGYDLGKVTLQFKDYNDVKSADLDIVDLDEDDSDDFLNTVVLEYANESKLRKANNIAKNVYRRLETSITDHYIYYDKPFGYKRYGKMLSGFDRSDEVLNDVYDEVKWSIPEDEIDQYYVYLLTDEGKAAKLVQIKGPDGIIGQYPDPAKTVDEARALKLSPEEYDP